ncbi:MAG TPA: hypothetical protein VH024_17625 [Candidatus Angelobacter sp.]|jgi:hypothetical protein|nr:hypothetical protein [Candidatus Angelobacter sp.]
MAKDALDHARECRLKAAELDTICDAEETKLRKDERQRLTQGVLVGLAIVVGLWALFAGLVWLGI